ncbi:MAG: hypothetical protein Q4G69_10185 [Planctomycetia bacterium]|nr:hypothetical protein [Planctomycetia bacterium]
MMKYLLTLLLILSALSLPPVHAVDENGPLPFTISQYTVEPITVQWAKAPYITECNKVYELEYTVSNSSKNAVKCELLFYSTDTIFPVDESGKQAAKIHKEITVPASGKIKGIFKFLAGEGTYRNVHYPLHLKATFNENGKKKTVHAARVIETDLSAPVKKMEKTIVRNGGISLLGKSYTALYQFDDKKPVVMGENFTGRDPDCSGSCTLTVESVSGKSERVFSMHPPYRPKGGKMFFEYPVVLPDKNGLTFTYYGAKSQNLEAAEKSDGVQFRFYIRKANGERVLLDTLDALERAWTSHTVPLDDWKGLECTFIIECNPGPKNKTNFDSCLLGGLLINTSEGRALKKDETSRRHYVFNLSGKRKAVIEAGENGLLDAKITLGDSKSKVSFDGVYIAVDDFFLNDDNARFTEDPVIEWKDKVLTCRYSLIHEDQISKVTLRARSYKGMLIIDVPDENPLKIGGLSLGAADKKAARCYFGHGYVVEQPKKVIIYGGGHGLSTSHVGFDFVNGPSLLMGTSLAPDNLKIDPDKNIYSLEITDKTSLALLPADSAFQAAIEYRKTCPWYGKPGPGVAQKIGRMVFDVWGGSAAVLTPKMKKVLEYGVTDSLFLQHVTQRWGYDIKLPDIWEPDSDTNHVIGPGSGPVEELRQFNLLCAKYGVPFGIHDNYIDFYPDADDFSYKYITFNQLGQPQKAWINPRLARSYKWRPELFGTFLERNMKICNRYMPEMDAYFVDVFSAAGVRVGHGQDGSYIPRHVTVANWKKAFDTISTYLSQKDKSGKIRPGITSSEAGDDFLIGSLDGADAQWLELRPTSNRYALYCPCGDWERTPWFSAVNHTNFIRHGAGYSSRYQMMRGRTYHGIGSDDYICSEILGGLCLMTDRTSFYPDSIRKHYLAQHVARAIAESELVSVSFENGEDGKPTIHRQKVIWSNGYEVYANRSADNWKVRDYILPEYGWSVYDKDGKFLAGIVCDPNNTSNIVELSQRPDSFYLNGRGYRMASSYQIIPVLNKFIDLGNGKFEVHVDWKAGTSLPVDASVFVHIFSEKDGFREMGWYAGGERPVIPTSQWGIKDKNRDTTVVKTGVGQILTVPKNLKDGVYHILVGLYDSKGSGSRFELEADSVAGISRYTVALLNIKRENEKVNVSVDKFDPKTMQINNVRTIARYQGNRNPFAWRGVETKGAVSVSVEKDSWKVLPLPMIASFEITLDEKVIGRIVKAVSFQGKTIAIHRSGSKVSFKVETGEAVPYEVRFN